MAGSHVFVTIGAVNECETAKPARPRSFSCVNVDVVLVLVFARETLVARLARKGKL